MLKKGILVREIIVKFGVSHTSYKLEMKRANAHKIMQPLLVTLDPSDEPASLVSHSGQEFNLVLEGSVAIIFDDKEIILNEGDTIYFNPTHPHGQKCIGNKKARFLTVIAE